MKDGISSTRWIINQLFLPLWGMKRLPVRVQTGERIADCINDGIESEDLMVSQARSQAC